MYKRFNIFILIMLTLASCGKEEVARNIAVQFNASVSTEFFTGSGETKAGGTETVTANHAVLQAWWGDILAVNVEQQVAPGTTLIDFGAIRLVGGVDYDVYIWVDNKDYYETDDLRNVRLNTEKNCDGKTKEFDAFFAYTSVNYGLDDNVHNVTLRRPFAKVSFSADVALPLKVKFTAPTTLNLKTGKVSGERQIEYNVQPEALNVASFDYVFADEGVARMNYTFKLGEEKETTTEVPISRNTKTNIIYNITD